MLAQEVDNSLEQKCHGLLFHPMTTSQMACEPVSRMIKLPSSEVVVIHVFGVDPGKLYNDVKPEGSSLAPAKQFVLEGLIPAHVE